MGFSLLCLACLLCVSSTAQSAQRMPADQVAEYIKQLQSTDQRVSWEAIEFLSQSKDPRAMDAFISAINSASNRELCCQILQSVHSTTDPRFPDAVIAFARKRIPETENYLAMAWQTVAKAAPNRLVPLLKDQDAYVRLGAARALIEAHSEQAVDVLIDGLRNTDPRLRELAAGGLVATRNPKAIEPLMQLLKDPNDRVRKTALSALAMCAPMRLFDIMCDMVLNDKSAGVRMQAAQFLGTSGDPKAVPVLLKVIRSDGQDVGAVASEALGSIHGPEVIPALLEAIKDRNSAVRLAAARSLCYIDDPKCNAALRPLLDDDNRAIREVMYEHLDNPDRTDEEPVAQTAKSAKPAKPKTTNDLLAQLKNTNPQARAQAIQALAETKEPKAVNPLVGVLKDKNLTVRDEAARALGKIGDRNAVPKLVAMLKPAGMNTLAAARALQRLRQGKLAFGAVAGLLQSKDPNLKRCAIIVLGDMRDPRAVPLLAAFLKNEQLQETTIRALARIGGPEAAKAMVPCLKTQTGWMVNPPGYTGVVSPYDTVAPWGVYPALEEIGETCVVPDIIPMLKDADAERRSSAAQLLGVLKDPRAVDGLIGLLKDDGHGKEASEPVCKIAAKALASIGDRRALPALLDTARNSRTCGSSAVEAIAELRDPESVEPLIALLNDPKTKTSGAEAAAIALGKTGDKRAFDPLMSLMDSSFPTAVRAAIAGLGDLGDPRAADRIFALKDGSPESAVALAKLKDPRAFDLLIELLKGQENSDDVVRALGILGDRRAVEPLEKMMTAYPCGPAIWSLGELRDTKVLHLFTGMLMRADADTTSMCIEALGKLKDRRALPEMMQLLATSDLLMTGGWLSTLDPNEQTYPIREWDFRPPLYKALASITGQSLGESASAWLNWWKTQPEANWN